VHGINSCLWINKLTMQFATTASKKLIPSKMKKLSREQMKNVFGGYALPPDDGGDGDGESIICNVACSYAAGSNTEVGTCSKETTKGKLKLSYCKCSIAKGTGC